jgi:DnaJ-domain-containing protein 1
VLALLAAVHVSLWLVGTWSKEARRCSEGISASGWLVIVCALALGFGVIRFMIVNIADRSSGVLPQAGQPAPRAWHDVLGVPAEANWEQIEAAHAQLIAPCRSAGVSDLGPEFTQMADSKTRELDAALEQARMRCA